MEGRGTEDGQASQDRSSCVTAIDGGWEEGLRIDTAVPSICGALGLF